LGQVTAAKREVALQKELERLRAEGEEWEAKIASVTCDL